MPIYHITPIYNIMPICKFTLIHNFMLIFIMITQVMLAHAYLLLTILGKNANK